jgi:flagellum-specific ATP synthase
VCHQHQDLVSIGAYRHGSNPRLDTALAMQDELNQFLRQSTDECAALDDTRRHLLRLADHCRQRPAP